MRAAMRSHAASAAIGAALLLYFGFMRLNFSTGAGLFEISANVFVLTLRIGGTALAGLALLLWAGWRPALLLDGLVSMPVGVLMVLCGAGMMVGGGGFNLNNVIILFCGAMFVSAGRHSLQMYRAFVGPNPGTEVDTTSNHEAPDQESKNMGLDTSASDPHPGISRRTEESATHPPSQANPPADGGYLAALGRRSDELGRGTKP